MRAAVPLITATLLATQAVAQSVEYGAYLASTCLGCHQLEDAGGAIPSITALETDDFRAAMLAYRNKTRPHVAMQTVAAGLTDDDIAALAAYFGSLQ